MVLNRFRESLLLILVGRLFQSLAAETAKLREVIWGFTSYGHGGHIGPVTWIIYIHIGFPFLYMLHFKLGLDLPAVSEEKTLKMWTNGRMDAGSSTIL